ncbi:toxin [Streptomyces californicus]|uniref:toxin n=1 Tax=Streptomyces TaxID=1883 RepID=UPI0015C4A1CE|nr:MULTISPECIES: toxin [Streptomyces]MBK0373358.1 toxin [Streptomyces sp. RB110-1]MBK0390274.1 toxin [Streptomyces sp. RB110-2]MCF3167374.1 toxin [Streptomyces violaceoruber]QLG30840.1 toxin [Streptomyces sp. CB04723]
MRTSDRKRRSQLRRLRKDGARRIAELGLPAGAGVSELCRHLGEIRNRPIKLIRMRMPACHPCGMWVAACDEDLIFYDANTNSAHQDHIILHELGHIICCHRGAGWLDEASARSLFPNIDPDLVRDMLQRTTYDDVQEQEAELIAYLLARPSAGAGEPPGGGPAPADSGAHGQSAALLRVERTLF